MSSWIHLVRHGRSALPFPDRSITSGEFRDWISLYNRTGITDDSKPSDELIALAEDASIIVCSDYPRSIESATRLAPGREPRISAVFREIGRPIPGDCKIRLPLPMWDRLSVRLWEWNVVSSDESIHAARRRAREAAAELVSLAPSDSRILFVGHGTLNALIGRELRREGWQGPRHVDDDYWGVASFRKEPASGAVATTV